MDKVAKELASIAKLLIEAAKYSGDPYWITAKWDGKCAKCDVPIKKGQKVFYYPKQRAMYGETCGHGKAASEDFANMSEAEDFYNR